MITEQEMHLIDLDIQVLSECFDNILIEYLEYRSQEGEQCILEHLPFITISAISCMLIKLYSLIGDREFIFNSLDELIPDGDVLRMIDGECLIPISLRRH